MIKISFISIIDRIKGQILTALFVSLNHGILTFWLYALVSH